MKPLRFGLFLLLAPVLAWLFGLIVIPQVDLALLSFQVRTGVQQHAVGLLQYRTFFEEPQYWHSYVRTAAMSLLTGLYDHVSRVLSGRF